MGTQVVGPVRNDTHILHVTQSFGGVQSYIIGIVENSRKEFRHSIACQPTSLVDRFIDCGAKWYRVSLVGKPSPFADLRSLFQLIRIISRCCPDVIHMHSAKAGFIGRLAARLAGFRGTVIYTPNAFSYLGFRGFRRSLFLALERTARPWTDVLLAVSGSEGGRSINEVGFDPRKVKIVPNAIECRGKARSYGFRSKVGMVGRLGFQKNPELFIEVALRVHQRFPRVTFALLGEGYHDLLKESVLKLIRENAAEAYIEVLKWGQHNMRDFYEELDLLLHTSRFEGLPFVLLEAMDSGLPVVATDVDGNRDAVVDSVTGYLLSQDDVTGMAERVCQILESEELRARLGLAGQQRVHDHFNIETRIREIEHVYLEGNLDGQLS